MHTFSRWAKESVRGRVIRQRLERNARPAKQVVVEGQLSIEPKMLGVHPRGRDPFVDKSSLHGNVSGDGAHRRRQFLPFVVTCKTASYPFLR